MNLLLTLCLAAPVTVLIGWLAAQAYDRWLQIEDSDRWFEKHENVVTNCLLVLSGVLSVPIILCLVLLVMFLYAIVS